MTAFAIQRDIAFTSVLLTIGCGEPTESGGVEKVDSGAETAETGRPDSVETGDSTPIDTGETADTGETGESATETGDTGDTAEETGTEDSTIDTDPTVLELDGEADAKLVGENAGDGGYADSMTISGGGDLNGDGSADIAIGMPYAKRGGTAHAGVAYVKYGPLLDRVDLGVSEAFIIGRGDGGAGSTIDARADLNADGIADLLVSQPYEEPLGYVYAFEGPISGTLGMDDAAGRFESRGHTNGLALTSLTDFNGDGFGDLAFTNYTYDDAYVCLGPPAGEVNASDSAYLWLDGEAYANVADAGDTDGDGRSELLVGWGFGFGAALIDDSVTGSVKAADAASGFFEPDHASAGQNAVSAGDVNGDGYGDLLFDSISDTEGGPYSGAAWVLTGPFAPIVDIKADGAKLVGAAPSTNAGYSMAGLGDLDGDGKGEVLIGAPAVTSGSPEAGAAYVVAGPMSGTLVLDDGMAILRGERGDRAGEIVSAGGDVDADGVPDLLVAGPADAEGGEDAGAVWLVLGATLAP